VQLDREAESRHHDRPTFARAVARAEAGGRAHVLMARRHPELLAELPLGQDGVPGRLRRVLWELGWSDSWGTALLRSSLRLVLRVAERGRFRHMRRRVANALQEDAYWRAVRADLGSRDAWETLRASGAAARAINERDYDLADGFAGLVTLLAAEPVDALRLRWRDTPIGRIPAPPAAEPLRPVHVRHALLTDFASILWTTIKAERPRA